MVNHLFALSRSVCLALLLKNYSLMSFTNLGMVHFYIYWWITRLVVALKNGTSLLHQMTLPLDDLTGVCTSDRCASSAVTCSSLVVSNRTLALKVRLHQGRVNGFCLLFYSWVPPICRVRAPDSLTGFSTIGLFSFPGLSLLFFR